MERFDAAQVRHYYDRHTPAFVALGEGRHSGAIHRAVWAPGVRSADEAIHYVDDQIAAAIQSLRSGSTLHVVDLGCGVAASLIRLADRLPIDGTGVTLSPVQVDIARQKISAAGFSARLQCIEGDFCALPATVGRADAAFAIESFVHVADAPRFFDQCRDLIRPGGLLIICDDFRADSALPRRSREAAKGGADRALEQFREGWHVNTLVTVDELRSLAHAAGFEHESTQDLTPYLRIGRPRDRLIGAFLGVLNWLPVDARRFDDLIGGHALQTCLSHGWIAYQLCIFRRT